MTDSFETVRVDSRKGRLFKQQAQQSGIELNARSRTFTYHSTSGIGQYTSLQDAIDAANADGGGTVVILPGTHIVSENITLYDNIKIVGYGTNSNVTFGNGSYSITGTNTDNITLSNFWLRNSTATNLISLSSCENVIINYMIIDGNGCTSDLKISSCINSVVEFNNFNVGSTNCIEVTGFCYGLFIKANRMYSKVAFLINDCQMVNFEGNYVEGTESDIPVIIKTTSTNTEHIKLLSNTIFTSNSARLAAIRVLGTSSFDVQSIVIANNIVTGFSNDLVVTSSIDAEYCINSVINSNVIQYAVTDSILLGANTDRMVVTGNIATDGITNNGTNNTVANNITS